MLAHSLLDANTHATCAGCGLPACFSFLHTPTGTHTHTRIRTVETGTPTHTRIRTVKMGLLHTLQAFDNNMRQMEGQLLAAQDQATKRTQSLVEGRTAAVLRAVRACRRRRLCVDVDACA